MKQSVLRSMIQSIIIESLEIDPHHFDNVTKDTFLSKGYRDGLIKDDVVYSKKLSIAANKLLPIQNAIYLEKAIDLALRGIIGGDSGVIVSRDNYILDGHHRWAATMLVNPNITWIVTKIDLNAVDLLYVIRAIGDALGNNRGTIPAGDINIFTCDVKDVQSITTNMGHDAINWFNNMGIATVKQRLKLIRDFKPSAGLSRITMPRIRVTQVPAIAKMLKLGAIDVRTPYAVEQILKK